MSLLGILAGLGLLVALAFRGWSVLLLAPTAALIVLAGPGSAFPACAPPVLEGVGVKVAPVWPTEIVLRLGCS